VATYAELTVALDGVDQSVTVVSGSEQAFPALSGNIYLRAPASGSNAGASGIYESIAWTGASPLSSANRLAIRQNIAAYYGITLS
jgi:hypothetical protein